MKLHLNQFLYIGLVIDFRFFFSFRSLLFSQLQDGIRHNDQNLSIKDYVVNLICIKQLCCKSPQNTK